MKEADYIKVSNLAKVRSGLAVLNDVINHKEYGMDSEKMKVVFNNLYEIQEQLNKQIKVEGE